ncbi:BTAD domain-containing putative transcriptional regulator [Streptomyces sp. NPDC056061]|uniref:AfsR/SARP family transcriptional regulator n=1 Tax=Streptomyces sp. NPDC056061 TaxID=3345700 RepID=UPI0035DF5198
MEFEIVLLGPVELRVNGHGEALGTPKARTMAAALAVDAGRPLSIDTLIHRLWDDNPPGKPRASLHAYATRIRQRLRGPEGDGPDPLPQQAHSYTLAIDPEQVDSHRFQRLCTEARALSDNGDDTGALALFHRAERLWRGDPLTGLTGLWAESVRANLREKHLAATLARADIELRLGHYAELVPDLSTLFEQHPTDETVARQLMVATYGCGRLADALRTYDIVRRRLSEHLGSDPGEELTRLYRRILDRAPLSALLSGPESARVVPVTLPSHGDLVGREEEMRALEAAPRTGAVIALQTITGMGGVGKTHVALHAARRLADRYPDGQIHIDLGAHAQGRRPLSPESALTTLLRAFGVSAGELPDDLDELVSHWRTLLSTRRAVIVLDDAADADQVRPLLPGSSASLIIITSRHRLAGLPGVRSLFLDVMPEDDAGRLFRRLAGEERTPDAADVARIVHLCGYLPLAVEIAAGRLVSRPSWTTSHLIKKLSRAPGRLDEIRDGYREIAGVFDMSYATLSPDQRTAFRMLGRHLGHDFDLYAASALTSLPLDSAERVLEALLDAHLVQEPSPDRYRFHDLIGEFARTLDSGGKQEEDHRLAVERLIDFYVRAAERADEMIHPDHSPGKTPPAPAFPLPEWPDAAAATGWLSQELTALLAAEQYARTRGHAHLAARLARALARFLDKAGYWAAARDMHEPAARYWLEAGDRQAAVRALIDLGTTLTRSGDYEPSLAAGHSALEVADALDDPEAEAEARHLLGVVHWHLGNHEAALSFQTQALERRLKVGDDLQLSKTRNNMGITHLFLKNYAAALECFASALSGFRRAGDVQEELKALNNMADLHSITGDQESSRRLLDKVLGSPHAAANPLTRATSQVNLANTMKMPEELNEALSLYRDALLTLHRLGDRRNSSITLHHMGLAFEAAGDDDRAAAHHEHALELATGIGAAHDRLQALCRLGATERRLGRTRAAIGHLEEAVDLADRIGATDEAAQAQYELSALRA